MREILIFAGRPGAGKTVLINEFLKNYSDFKSIDVYNHIRTLKDKHGKVPEEIIIGAYKQFYQEVYSAKDNLVLEIGTNYPGFNLHKLVSLTAISNVTLFLCQLDIKLCRERCLARAGIDTGKDFKGDALEIRLKRVFPALHQKFADKLGISYYQIDMSLSVEQRLDIIVKKVKELNNN